MLPGEPNEYYSLNEDCGNYITSATSDTDMRASQATHHSGLNDCPCDPVHSLGGRMPVVLCSRDPVPTFIPASSANLRDAFSISSTSLTDRFSISMTSPSNHYFIRTYKKVTQLSLRTTPALKPAIAQVNGNSSFNILLAFVALVGWILLACAVAYMRVSISAPSWLRLWRGGARGSRVGPFLFKGLNEFISNREHNELKATASAWSVSDGLSNVSSSIGPVGDSSQAEQYVPPPLQLSQKESEAPYENDYHFVNKYTRMQEHAVGTQGLNKASSYRRLVEDDDPELYL